MIRIYSTPSFASTFFSQDTQKSNENDSKPHNGKRAVKAEGHNTNEAHKNKTENNKDAHTAASTSV